VHILIVEDDERIVGFMKRGLEAEGHDIDIASGKSQTLSLINTRSYDVIILDIFLGPDDGLDICRTLRGHQVTSIILIMTAKGTAEIERASKRAGANAYLAKPFSFDDLVETIARLHKAAASPDTTRRGHASSTEEPEHQAHAFTNSEEFRPTDMSRRWKPS
jgi:two-component system, OmpR family, response regulator